MIISASRRTDIPAFYSEWFFNRIREGFVYVRNPINIHSINKISLSPSVVDCIVFWTKNPSKSFLDKLYNINDYNFYFQFTINSYDTSLEQNVPRKKSVIDNFISLSKLIGKSRVIWRYDPILLSDTFTIEYHIEYFEKIIKRIYLHTEKCIISFIDFYKKCERNLKNTTVRELKETEVKLIAEHLQKIASKYGIIIETCAEKYDLLPLSISHGRCIDNVLIEKITGLKVKAKKDKNQRDICGCIGSIDIGEYNTCKHNCLYCYANFNKDKVSKNIGKHNPNSPLIIGNMKSSDILKEKEITTILESTLF